LLGLVVVILARLVAMLILLDIYFFPIEEQQQQEQTIQTEQQKLLQDYLKQAGAYNTTNGFNKVFSFEDGVLKEIGEIPKGAKTYKGYKSPEEAAAITRAIEDARIEKLPKKEKAKREAEKGRISMADSGRYVLANESIKDVQEVRDILFPTGEESSFRRDVAAGINPFDKDTQEVSTKVARMLSAKLLLQSGVAVRPEELTTQAKAYIANWKSNPKVAMENLDSLANFYSQITNIAREKGIQDVYSLSLNKTTQFVRAPQLALRSEAYYMIYVINNGIIFAIDMRGQRDVFKTFIFNPINGITNWIMPWHAGKTNYFSAFPNNSLDAKTTTLSAAISSTDTTIPLTGELSSA